MAPITNSRGSRTTVKEREASEGKEELEEFQNRNNDADSDKDSTEEELERLVFGDGAGFRDGIRNFREAHELSTGKELVLAEDYEDQTQIEDVDDADVCWSFKHYI